MKRALILLIAVGLVGCGRGSSRLTRDQQQYEVVQEGSASGVTSTIAAPGETTPPITGTNADTTTAFSMPMGGVTSPSGQPGTIAGTLPTDTTGGMVYPPGMPPRAAAPRPRPVAQPPVQVQAPPPMTSNQPEQQPAQQQQPQPAQPSTQPPPPPETTTQAPPPPPETNTAPPPEKKKDEKKDDEQEQQPDEQPAPPPPTQTDTFGPGGMR